jgi:hypothetical protein
LEKGARDRDRQTNQNTHYAAPYMKRFLLPILALVFGLPLFAQDPEKVATQTRIQKQSPTENGDRGLFTVPSVETLNQGQFSFGYSWSNTDRSPRDLNISSLPVFLSVGVLGRLTVTGSFDTNRQITAHNLVETGFNSQYPFVSKHFAKGSGDTLLIGKYRLQRTRDNLGGIALRTTVKFPTADEAKGLGTGKTDVGADVIFTSLLPWKFLLNSNIGYTSVSDAKDPVTQTTRKLKNRMGSGLGTAWPAEGLNIFKGSLQGIFEYSTLTFVGGGAANAGSSVQNSSDIAAGLRFLMLDSGVTLHAGYRTNTKVDDTFPGNVRRDGFTFSLSYTKPVRPPGNNRFPVVSLETLATEITPGGTADITATGYDADNDRLSYSWTTTGGTIVGFGEKVTFNAGTTPGKYTIRAIVTDGRGGTGVGLIEVTVRP